MKLFNRILGSSRLSSLGGGDASSARHQGREIEVVVKGGYRPGRIEIVQGERVRLKFIRKESSGCSREVTFPELGIRKELPEGVPVVIPLPELEAGEYQFTCGMNMLRGEVTVLPQG